MRPLSVLVVTQSYHPHWGGIGEHARNLGLALAARGHRIRILTSGPVPQGGELPGPEVVRIGRHFTVPSNGSRAHLACHPAYRRAVRRVLAAETDLIHIHSPLEPFLPWAVLEEASTPCVGTFHNAGRPPAGYRLLRPWLARLAERLQLRLAVSRCAARYVGRHFPGEYLLVPNGVDMERFAGVPPRLEEERGAQDLRKENRRPRTPTILFVGSLEARKGIDLLVDGVARASRRMGWPLRLMVVGDGSLRRRLFRLAQRSGVRLEWKGNVDHAALPACYRDADLLAAPSLYGESFGIVLLEALASGIPVVASQIEGYQELLGGCGAAYLFTPRDAQSMATGIVALLRTGRDRPLSALARGHAAPFAWDRVSAMTESGYAEALGERTASLPRIRVAGDGASFELTPGAVPEPWVRQA